MFTARSCESGAETGAWFAVILEPWGARRAGYCATGCAGHSSREEALAHYLQFQLDREADLWLDRRSSPGECEICGEPTTLRARLGRDTKLFVLCRKHQSTSSLQTLFHRRVARQPTLAVP
jgi:hypothetical protein